MVKSSESCLLSQVGTKMRKNLHFRNFRHQSYHKTVQRPSVLSPKLRPSSVFWPTCAPWLSAPSQRARCFRVSDHLSPTFLIRFTSIVRKETGLFNEFPKAKSNKPLTLYAPGKPIDWQKSWTRPLFENLQCHPQIKWIGTLKQAKHLFNQTIQRISTQANLGKAFEPF